MSPEIKLHPKIPNETKTAIIRLYLNGVSRNKIAEKLRIGAGTATNIINEWRDSLSYPDADALRELSTNLKRFAMDVSQCARGFRTYMIMSKLGIDEHDFESFIKQIFSHCQQNSITPEQIVSNLKPLVELSKSVPIEKIPDFIEAKKSEINKLEQNIERSTKQNRDLNMETSVLREIRDAALREEKMTCSELYLFSKVRTELAQYGLSMETDIPKLGQVISQIKNLGCDPGYILSEFSGLRSVKFERYNIEMQIRGLKSEKSMLERDCTIFREQRSKLGQTFIVYSELNSLGFGPWEATLLRNLIYEAAKKDNISGEQAFQKLFRGLEKGLDERYGTNNALWFSSQVPTFLVSSFFGFKTVDQQ